MNAKPLRILVVDDDKNFAHTLCDILHSEGYEAEEVHSVKGAQKILEKQHIDCVLSDVRMPEKSGTDFYQEIKGQYPNLPFILMTAYTSSEIIDQALQSGVLKAIHKPINIQETLRFFAKLKQDLKAAVICKEEHTCDVMRELLETDRFTYTIYESIKSLLKSHPLDYSIVLIDSQDYCDHYSSEIEILLDCLPERTVVVVCDYSKYANSKEQYQERINLIILPREKKTFQRIDGILQEEFYQYAKKIIK